MPYTWSKLLKSRGTGPEWTEHTAAPLWQMSHRSTPTWPQWRRSKPISQWRHLTSYLPESHTEVIWRIDTGCEEKIEGWGGGNCGSGTSSGEQAWDCSVGRKTVLRSVSTDKLIPNTSNTYDVRFYSASRQNRNRIEIYRNAATESPLLVK